MLACLHLLVFVSFPLPLSAGQAVQHEWHYHTFCEPRAITDVPLADSPLTECELAANMYLYQLQIAGILPGSKDVMQYKATCTTTI